jgi:hypothetical protein
MYISSSVTVLYLLLGGLIKSKVRRKFVPRTNCCAKMGTYIPDIQVRPHPCILSRTLLIIVFKNPVNINCCIFHCHICVIRKLITGSFTTVSYPYIQLLCSCSAIICSIPSPNVRSNSLCRKIKLLYDPY